MTLAIRFVRISLAGVIFLLAYTFLAWAVFGLRAQAAVRVDNAVVFLVDVSSSMNEEERRIARESHAAAMMSPEVVNAILSNNYQRSAFAYAEYASTAAVIVDWTIIDSPQAALAFANRIRTAERPNMGYSTSVSDALEAAALLLKRLPVEALYLTVDIFGDGANQGTMVPVSVPRAVLLDMGASINVLPLSISPDRSMIRPYKTVAEWFEGEVMGGPRGFSFPLEDIRQMPMGIRRKLLMELY